MKSLRSIAARHPFPGYQAWWPMGALFTAMMRQAITTSWQETVQDSADPEQVRAYTRDYIHEVYHREARFDLVPFYLAGKTDAVIMSGEFDALSYAFFRSAFEALRSSGDSDGLHRFTQVVGERFFARLAAHLALDIPRDLIQPGSFAAMQSCIARTGDFLVAQGYLRDSFAFEFEVHLVHNRHEIHQSAGDVSQLLRKGSHAHALYRMAYPAILPSAVFLFNQFGEAQHHSSRTIEELFARAGCKASETKDFDPTGFPPEEVVELWEIQTN